MKQRIKALKLNKRLMFGTRFFVELKSLNSVIQLFYLSRGLDLGQIVYLSLVWTITSFICDVPSSFLADKFGRKKLIILGILLTAVSTAMLFNASTFLTFIFAYMVGAAGYSFFAGADHALLYDSLKETGEESNANRVAGKYFSSASLPKVIMPLIGSIIAKGLLPSQFLILIGIDFIGTIISMGIALFLTEPHVKEIKVNKLGLIQEGLRLIKDDKILLKFALNKIIVFQASFVFWRIYQVLLKNADMPIIYLGVLYTVFQGINFLLFWNTEKVQNKVGKANFMFYPPILGVIAVVSTLLTSNLTILFLACTVLFTVGVVRDPLFMAQIQSRIPSHNRATATSTLNIIKNISDIPLLLLIGYLANININYVLVISTLLFILPIIFLRIKREEL
ncbi:MAG: MFS transporter [bacterium]|nr:MAG: MFS transporter [bacterium]